MKLFYLETASWEYDFIINDLLDNIKIDIEVLNVDNFNLLINRDDIIGNNILVVNECCQLNNIINISQKIKPIVIFYTGDEIGNRLDVNVLEQYTQLFFRQYNHKHYNYGNNNYQLLLGYSKHFLNNKKSSEIIQKKIADREFNCSFIGSCKSDRSHMANIFINNMKKTNIQFVHNNWNINNLPVSPKDCFDTYNNSIFVISGRGNYSLDCFRIYEAIIAGAIPIVVGTIDEIETTFNYQSNIPPIIHSETWEDAVIKCNDLLKQPELLQKMQDDLIVWWNEQIKFINELIIQKTFIS